MPDTTEALDTSAHVLDEIAIGRAFPPDLPIAFLCHWTDWLLDRYAAAQEAGR